MLDECIWPLLWMWGGGMIPVMAVGALAKDDVDGWLTAVVAISWPILVGVAACMCITDDED